MSEVSLLSWNAECAFGDRERNTKAAETIIGVKPDIAYISEMTDRTTNDNSAAFLVACETLSSQGYTLVARGNVPRATTGLWVRDPESIKDVSGTNIGGRTTSSATIAVLNSRMHAFHGDDNSADNRLNTIEVALQDPTNNGKHLILLGDFNSMNSRDPKSFAPRIMDPLVNSLPSVKDPYDMTKPLSRLWGHIQRAASMSTDGCIARVEAEGLQTANPNHLTTIRKMSGVLRLTLDHIYTSPGLTTSGLEVHDTKVSDHYPISTVISSVSSSA